ncbi:EVE domain-containing protein [Ancylobacter sp. A5.8]|uniref:EVE domain-containing protein n=1 Tax=Ancylobacter gelatini TaxID=2919920 RepID=UPI001F4D679F|nr:EVE domain-containing protein [Ancylobacter gelatini]MCJ8144869.1 EVE domain-containing protein [Ancylobacter gelatini]
MAHWLYKSEPFKWSWDQQVAAGAKGTHWDGVRNHLAKQQLLAMKTGDRGFFYHSNEGKEIVGIVEVIREAYPDPSDPTGKFVMVDIKAVEALPNPVTLAAVKAEPRLSEMALMKFSRLSVQPVTDEEWAIVLEMSRVGAAR